MPRPNGRFLNFEDLILRFATRPDLDILTNNASEHGTNTAKRHQAVSGCWHSLAPRPWCRLRSYLDSAAAHGISTLDAISSAIVGKPWLPPLPAIG